MRFAKVIRWIGHGWIGLAVLFILLSYAAIWYFSGWAAMREIANPLNFINVAAIIVTLLPGIGLIKLSEYIERRSAASKIR